MQQNRHPGPEIAEWRRFRALKLYELGWFEVDIAEALGVNKGSVSRWLAAADAGGPEALLGCHLYTTCSRIVAEGVPRLGEVGHAA